MKIWVATRNNGGGEGYSEPLRAFANERLANLFKDEVEARPWGTSIELTELEVVEEVLHST